MIRMLKKSTYAVRLFQALKRTAFVMANEYRLIVRDPGILIVFLGACLVYPLLYCSIYKNETVYDLPVAVVDQSHSTRSLELIRDLNATPELKVTLHTGNLIQARRAFENRRVHGIILIPADYSVRIGRGEQATVSTYSDMSSFLYYRAMTLATNYTVLHSGNRIKEERLEAAGISGESRNIFSEPLKISDNILFNRGMGFASFLMPAVLILIIHQTLFFGIAMLAGTARERNSFGDLLVPGESVRHLTRIIFGKSLCYFLLYFVLSAYILEVIPRWFDLPHIGNLQTLTGLMIPFLLATIFFSMTLSVFMRHRETGLVFLLFFSLILLFISGFSWPMSNISRFWQVFGWFFPATHGIQGYLKINGMGAHLQQISSEYITLWCQTAIYFCTTLLAYHLKIRGTYRNGQNAVQSL